MAAAFTDGGSTILKTLHAALIYLVYANFTLSK
jgi:hypothetical protein